MRTKLRRIDGLIGGRNHISDKPLAAGTIGARQHDGLRHRRMPEQRRLDLAGLDAEAAQLDLLVRAPDEIQHAVGAPARQIAGAVHAAARGAEWVGDEPFGGQPAPPQIAPRQTFARNVKLADDAGRRRLETAIQNIDARVVDGPANRNRAGQALRFIDLERYAE